MSESDKICFVISPIGDDGSETRKRADHVLNQIIKPACKACGYKAIRADEISIPGKIDNHVIQHLIEDPLVIADLTEGNPNVFYELAIRHTLKKPVVQITEEDEIPFDVTSVSTIHFEHNDEQKCKQCESEIITQIQNVEQNPELVDAPIKIPHFPYSETFATEEKINDYMLNLISKG